LPVHLALFRIRSCCIISTGGKL